MEAPYCSGNVKRNSISAAGHLRKVRHRLLDRMVGILEVLELPVVVALVGRHVEVAVAGEVEDDHLLLAGLPAKERLVDRGADRGRGLRRRDDPLRFRELDCRVERLELPGRAGLDVAVRDERAHQRSHAVVPETPRVDPGRHERVPERVHLHDRRHPGRVAVIPGMQASARAVRHAYSRARSSRSAWYRAMAAATRAGSGGRGAIPARAPPVPPAPGMVCSCPPDRGMVPSTAVSPFHADVSQHQHEGNGRTYAGSSIYARTIPLCTDMTRI